MMKRLCPAVVLFVLIMPCPVVSREQPLRLTLSTTTVFGGLKTVSPQAGRGLQRVGVALAGGGAKAAASIGVLKVLAEEGIPVSAVAGTSMGALVGGMLSAGYTPDEIEKLFLATDWNDIFRDTPPRAFLTQEQKEAGSRYLLEFYFENGRFVPPTGLSAGQKLANLLAAKTLAASFQAGMDFDKLPVPFRAVATDLETGSEVVLGRGLLHDAMRASAAIPVVFQPVELQGRLLADGGLANNLPVDVVKTMNVDVVIAVDSSSRPETREHLTSLLDIMGQSVTITVQKESRRQAALADLVIAPDTSAHSFTDFPKMDEIIRAGEEAARTALPQIRKLAQLQARAPGQQERFHITSLVVRGNQTVPEAAIRSALAGALAHREATSDDVLVAMAAVYRLGFFSDVAVDLEREGASYRALLTVVENPVVKAVELSGIRMIPSSEIRAALEGQVGMPLNVTNLLSALDRVVERYREHGYLLVRVAQAGMKADGSTLGIVMEEGRVDAVLLSGQKKTRPSLIRREIEIRTGEPLNFDALARDVHHLYGLDYFESVGVAMARSPAGGVFLAFKIKEKPTMKVRLGLRYDLEDSFTGLTDLIADNVGGRGIKLFLNMLYGTYTDITLGYRTPVFLQYRFTQSLQGFYRRRTYFVYLDDNKVNELGVSRTGIDASFGYQWFHFGDTSLRYRYSTDQTEETVGIAPAKTRARIGSLAFLSSVDTRDNQPFARKGILFTFSYETAAPTYGGDTEFRKTSLFCQGFLPLGERHTVMLEGSAGFGSGELPYDEKFGIGGADYLISVPLLGYERREFVGLNELGAGIAYRWKVREYQLKAVKALYLTVAGQAANVWDSREAMSFHDLRYGGGIGLHADTLIGPVRLDVGAGEKRRRAVYFSAGFDF